MTPTTSKASTITLVFVGLAVVYAALVIAASLIGDAFAQGVLVGTGTAVLGSGLTFLLLRVFSPPESRN